MSRSGRARMLWLLLLLLASLRPFAVAQLTTSSFAEAFQAIPVSQIDRFVAAIDLALGQTDFPASEALHLAERLVAAPYSAQEKEALLLNIVIALENGLPIDGLVTKALEGLARGVCAPKIEQSLHQRLVLLTETRDLLLAKGIFSVAPGAPRSVPTALPTPRFNALVTQISSTIADYLEGGGSPFEGETLSDEVRFRLTSLKGVTLNADDVDLVLRRIEPDDLTRVALPAVT